MGGSLILEGNEQGLDTAHAAAGHGLADCTICSFAAETFAKSIAVTLS